LQEYVSLSFSPDGKLLLAQGGGPDWNLLLWAWEKSKVASSIRSTNLQGSPVVQVSKQFCAEVSSGNKDCTQHSCSSILQATLCSSRTAVDMWQQPQVLSCMKRMRQVTACCKQFNHQVFGCLLALIGIK
jgi:WD40 repeat protein